MVRKKFYQQPTVLFFGGAIILVIILVAVQRIPIASGGQYDGFAQCVTQSGAKMYGAYWCPHCANQKALFGEDVFNEEVDYVECAIPGQDQRAQTQVCRDAGIEGYPTWIFTDGTRLQGEQSLEKLAQQAGCAYGDAAQSGDADVLELPEDANVPELHEAPEAGPEEPQGTPLAE